jgi:hypothetical protein
MASSWNGEKKKVIIRNFRQSSELPVILRRDKAHRRVSSTMRSAETRQLNILDTWHPLQALFQWSWKKAGVDFQYKGLITRSKPHFSPILGAFGIKNCKINTDFLVSSSFVRLSVCLQVNNLRKAQGISMKLYMQGLNFIDTCKIWFKWDNGHLTSQVTSVPSRRT